MLDDFFEDLQEWRHEKLKEYAYEEGFAAGEQAAEDEELDAQYEEGFSDGMNSARS